MRRYRYSPKCGTRQGEHFCMVAPKIQMGYHCYYVSRDNVVHGREAMVLCVKAVQKAQQSCRAKSDRNVNGQYRALLE